jgi:hypothetical protein
MRVRPGVVTGRHAPTELHGAQGRHRSSLARVRARKIREDIRVGLALPMYVILIQGTVSFKEHMVPHAFTELHSNFVLTDLFLERREVLQQDRGPRLVEVGQVGDHVLEVLDRNPLHRLVGIIELEDR